MESKSFEAKIADLDKTTGSPKAVLEAAAQILGVDLEENIERSRVESKHKTSPDAYGFKEQWLLRWLLKRLNASDTKSGKQTNASTGQSISLCPQFWTLVLHLVDSIPDHVCLEILLERKFFETIDQSIRTALQSRKHDAVPGSAAIEEAQSDEPPTKKRRLSPRPSTVHDLNPKPEADQRLVLLQAACRCVDLLNISSKNRKESSKHIAPTWTANPNDQASLLGSLLQMFVSIMEDGLEPTETTVLSELLNSLLSFWGDDASAGRTQSDDSDRAFASHCLMPSLVLLDVLRGPNFDQKSFGPPKNALGRLVARHTVFPARAMFNERFAKKWRGMEEVLLYERLETILTNLRDRMFASESPSHPELSWLIFEIAARSLPTSNLRKRQSEQPFIDVLFISLAHVFWPQMPRITGTGVVIQELSTTSTSKTNEFWPQPLEHLVDIALAQKLHVSLPILGYILSAILAADRPSFPWNLVAKLLRLDVSILIPSSGLSTSPDLLKQVLSQIESGIVSMEIYTLIRDEILLPLLRGFARSRDMQGFIAIWQQNMSDAIRVRYTSKQDPDLIPAILAWEDEDLLEEFKTLSLTHAPPTLGQRLLASLLGPMAQLAEKVGSTADIFSSMTIFCTWLESLSLPGANMDINENKLVELLSAAMTALTRKADFQGQRWKLWKLIRIVVCLVGRQRLPPDVEKLLGPEYNFLSLKEAKSLTTDLARRHALMILEHLECFSLTIELAPKSPKFRPVLQAEVNHLTDILLSQTSCDHLLWDGRSINSPDLNKLVAASIGSLLQRPEIFSNFPDIFKSFTESCLKSIYSAQSPELGIESSPTLLDLCVAVLEVAGTTHSSAIRDKLLAVVAELSDSNSDSTAAALRVFKRLSRSISMDSMSKSTARQFGASITRRLFQQSEHQTHESVADHLDFLIYLESLYAGSTIDCKDWRKWVDFSSGLFAPGSPQLSQSHLTAVHMLGEILRTIWKRAIGAPKTPFLAEITSWTSETIRVSKKNKNVRSAFFCSQIFLSRAYLSSHQLSTVVQAGEVEKMRQAFMLRLKTNLDTALRSGLGVEELFDLWLALDASSGLGENRVNEEIQLAASSVQRELEQSKKTLSSEVLGEQGSRVILSIRDQCLQLASSSETSPEFKTVELMIGKLASTIGNSGNRTNEELSTLAVKADLIIRQIGPLGWPTALAVLREKRYETDFSLIRPVLISSLLSRIQTQHLTRQPQLALELTKVACMDCSSDRLDATGMFLALENCKEVLERHPLLMNQAALDRLLSSLHAAASPAATGLRPLDAEGELGPSPADLYERLCAVIGAVLSRHRKRLSDRYHLLLPVLQSLLRCLFWPGTQSVLEDQRRFVTTTIDSFSKTLPSWVRESEKPLPPSSADHFSRLLSSVCNPTVSAARSSKTRGHNDLNDEIKRARQLAGQHMQYLVMEYARCTLDGQIAPSVKEHLMPGLYRVMDSMDRDLMRALNAGLDASSRAIFKGLYDDWSRYGKWDKS